MLAFLIGFIATLIIGGILIVTLHEARDRCCRAGRSSTSSLGGVLFVFLAVLITGVHPARPRHRLPARAAQARSDVPWLTSIHRRCTGSVIGGWIDATIVPLLLTVFGPLLPDEFERLVLGPA